MFIYFSISNILAITIIYLIIGHTYLTRKDSMFFLLIVLISCIVSYYSSLFGSFLFFILLFSFSIILKSKNDIFKVILNTSAPFIINSFTNILISPLERMHLRLNTGQSIFNTLIVWEFIFYFIIFLFSYIYVKFLLPIIIKKKRVKKFFIVLILLFYIYEAFILYKYLNLNFLKTLLIILIILIALFMFFITKFLLEKQRLQFQVQEQKIEKKYLQLYSRNIQTQYDTLRKFKHDYINILSSLEYFIELNDIDTLKKYYSETIKPTQKMMNTKSSNLNQLDNIKAHEIKSILAVKLISAEEENLNINIEIPDIIENDYIVSTVILIRMLSILLDNSIEELVDLEEGSLQIGIWDMNESYLFLIKNSIRKNIEPLHILKQDGFSTKGVGRGIGLSNLTDLTKKEQHLSLQTEITENEFIQKITIQKVKS